MNSASELSDSENSDIEIINKLLVIHQDLILTLNLIQKMKLFNRVHQNQNPTNEKENSQTEMTKVTSKSKMTFNEYVEEFQTEFNDFYEKMEQFRKDKDEFQQKKNNLIKILIKYESSKRFFQK